MFRVYGEVWIIWNAACNNRAVCGAEPEHRLAAAHEGSETFVLYFSGSEEIVQVSSVGEGKTGDVL